MTNTGWIVSPRYDTLFFTASLAAPLLLWAGFSAGWLTGIAVYAIFQLAFNLPHNFQTWTLSVLDHDDRTRNGRTYLIAAVVTLLVLGLPMLLSPDGVYPWVRDALIYWGYYHLVRQHYGFQRMYERKMGGVSARESWLYGRFLDVVSYAPLLLRFRDPELMTVRVGPLSTWIWHPVLPTPAVAVVASIYALTLLAALGHHVVMAVQRRPGFAPRGLLFLSVAACFAIANLAIAPIIVAIAVVTSFHNLQYLGLLLFHNRQRAAAGATAGNPAVSWLSSGKVALYVAATLLFGVVIFAPRALFQSVRIAELPIAFVVAMHYFVDARLFQFKNYPKRAEWLGLTAPKPAPVTS
ncbi:MAG: hypothetical protein JNG84_02830 [Archangium sp.]|nr:hypothetical protein [Archangium sp.]